MRYLIFSLILILFFACNGKRSANEQSITRAPAAFEIIQRLPHSTEAFTQGLVLHNDSLLESTGGENSYIAYVERTSGEQQVLTQLSDNYFGEGITILNDKIYQLTWRSKLGFVYDYPSMKRLREFSYETEGWGLTHDGTHLIMSDGTEKIYYLDTASFRVVKTLTVKKDGAHVKKLNELEFIEGKIYANQWETNNIFVIDTAGAEVVRTIDFTNLQREIKPLNPDADVLNGIAYDPKLKALILTGKKWPLMFVVRLSNQSIQDS